jgi:putative membrane protein
MLYKKAVTFLAGIVFLFCGWTRVLAQEEKYRDWYMGPGMMGGWGMGWFGGIFFLIFWILVIVGLVFLIKWLIQMSKSGAEVRPGGSRALDILKERYARSEIDKEEFEQKKKDLTG